MANAGVQKSERLSGKGTLPCNEGGSEQTDPEYEEDEDLHVCKKCSLAFRDIQKYLAHKVKHDNYKIKYCRSEVDKRMIMPKLIYKPTVKKDQCIEESPATVITEERENEGTEQRKKRGRKKIVESINHDLVIKEKPVYACLKCDKKFNREATLRRHNDFEHADKDDAEEEGDDDDDNNEDDNEDDDAEYKPSVAEVKEEIAEDNQEAAEMPPITTEEMAEIGQVDRAVVVPPDGVIVIPGDHVGAEMCEDAEDDDGEDNDGEVPTLKLRQQESASENDDGSKGVDQVGTAQTEAISQETDGCNLVALVLEGSSPAHIVRGPPPLKRQKTTSSDDGGGRKYACHICGNKFKEAAVLRNHMLVHSSNREFVCEVEGCSYAFKTKGSLRRHMRRHTGERPFPCDLCGRTFVESGALTRHMKSRVPCTAKSDNDLPRYGKRWSYLPNIAATQWQQPPTSEPTPTVTTSETVDSGQLEQIKETLESSEIVTVAQISGSSSSDTLATVVQVLDSDLPAYEESVINAVIDDATDSSSEFVQETEVDSVTTVCRVCNEDLFSLEALKIHLRTHLADRALKCWMCHFIVDDKDQFTEHMFTQHAVQLQTSDPFTAMGTEDIGDKDQEAVQKDAQLAVKQLLELPADSVDGEDPDQAEQGTRLLYKCPVCLRKFRGSNYLKLHMRNHTGLRPHKCPQCEKSFITKDTLSKHMNVHTNDRNFKCGECGKLFKRLSHVREHIKTHSTARSFPCHICDKSFKTNNAMKVHLRTHTDILPYVCPFCHRRFREKGSVIRHKRIHTGEKPFQCRHCFRCFAEHGTLNRHLKAKVSCKRSEEDGKDYPTVLAEFSSVVADTQYIVPASETVEASLIKDEAQQAAEYVVVTDLENQELSHVQNVEIVSSDDGSNLVEGVQVSDNYIVITDPESGGMKIIDSRSGETVAFVPVANADGATDSSQTVLVSADAGTGIQAVAMAPLLETETEDLASVLTDGSTCVEIHQLGSDHS